MANIAPAAWEVARAACPKHMAHGPCAGVSDSGACEVPSFGHRPDAMAVFDLDSTGLTALARRFGLLVSVAHAPAGHPTGLRLPRLLTKIAAGADVVVVDHCGGVKPVHRAVGALRAAGFTGTVLACVPVAADTVSAAVLASFAAHRLPPGYLAHLFEAADQRVAGIEAAVTLARRLLAHPGLDGVNLSGGSRAGHDLATARDLAVVGRELRP